MKAQVKTPTKAPEQKKEGHRRVKTSRAEAILVTAVLMKERGQVRAQSVLANALSLEALHA